MFFRRITIAVLASAVVYGCADQAPISGPGTMTVTLRSPNGDEGAAVVSLLGDDVGDVGTAGAGEVYSFKADSVTRVVVIDQNGGELTFRVAVADTTNPPAWVVDEVAGPDDALRGVTGYTLEFRR